MKRFLIVCIFLFHFSYTRENVIFSMLQKEYIEQITENNLTDSQIVAKGFESYHRIAKQYNSSIVLAHSNIKNFFLLPIYRSNDDQIVCKIEKAQQLMLVFLYAKIFRECIEQTEQLIEQLLPSLEYWQAEKFCSSLPLLRKHPVYWYHSPQHKKLINQHVKVLEQVEQEIISLLGLSLFGRYELSNITDDQNLFCGLQRGIKPMYEHFNVPFNDGNVPPQNLFQDIVWMQEKIENSLQECKNLLIEHKKPHHIIEHGFLYGCLGCIMVASYITYKVNEKDVPEYVRKSKEAWETFVKEYITIPLNGLKEVAWDNKVQRLKKIESPEYIPEFNLPLGLDKLVNSFVRFINKCVENGFRCLNDNFEIIDEKVMRNQQINLHLAAIGPVLLVSYLLYRGGKSMYNQHIQHESWYKPMKLLVRKIDQLLNQLRTNKKRSYKDDGLLHVLILRLKSFICCLNNEDLRLIEQDITELLAYDLSYKQKRGVLERMYRTYDFLK